VCVYRFDYVGIVMAITGSLMPWLYYGCHCRLGTLATHVALSLSLCAVCLVYIGVMFDEFVRQRGVKAGTSSGADGYLILTCYTDPLGDEDPLTSDNTLLI